MRAITAALLAMVMQGSQALCSSEQNAEVERAFGGTTWNSVDYQHWLMTDPNGMQDPVIFENVYHVDPDMNVYHVADDGNSWYVGTLEAMVRVQDMPPGSCRWKFVIPVDFQTAITYLFYPLTDQGWIETYAGEKRWTVKGVSMTGWLYFRGNAMDIRDQEWTPKLEGVIE